MLLVEVSLAFYLMLTFVIYIFDALRYRRKWYDPLYVYLVVVTLYVVPLSIRYILDLGISGNVTHFFYDIKEVFPFAVFFTAIANFVFYLTYVSCFNNYHSGFGEKIKFYEKTNLTVSAVIIFSIGFFAFFLLVQQFGGVISFLLAGYGVTEKLSENPLMATSMPVMFVSCFLFLASAHKTKSKSLFVFSVSLFTLLIIVNLVLARRAEIAVWSIAGILYYSVLYRHISFRLILPAMLIGFISLNFLGVVRQAEYESFDALIERLDDKMDSVESDNSGLFYTLTDGQFAVPFETLPVLIEKKGTYNYQLGSTLITNLSLWVPRFIWNDKPYGTASWYYRSYYDPSASPNIGRQFFYLSEGYLNFGILGILIWAVLWGMFWKLISINLSSVDKEDVSYVLVFISTIYTANMLRLVAADSATIFVTIIKQTVLWFLIGIVLSKVLSGFVKLIR